ncbi:MAG: twin-arginine translocation signal domain-containing protein, partial [Candidatus Rokuibacteriota bacterium]
MAAESSGNDRSAPEPGRRRFLKRGVALGAALVAGTAPSIQSRAQSQPAPDDPSKVLGGPIRPYGERSRFEQTSREKSPFSKTDEVGGSRT